MTSSGGGNRCCFFMSGVLHSNILVERKFIMQAIVETLFYSVYLITVINVVVMSDIVMSRTLLMEKITMKQFL